MVGCRFCEVFNLVKEFNAKSHIEHEYSVDLIVRGIVNEQYKGRTVHCDHKLNYCPECGKNLDGNITPIPLVWPEPTAYENMPTETAYRTEEDKRVLGIEAQVYKR